MQEQIQKRRIPSRRSRFRKTLLPYASDSALTGLQIIFLFSVFHDSLAIRFALFWFAVLFGVWGSVPLLKSLFSRSINHPFSLAIFQRSLPSILLLVWGESHVLDSSYIPFNRMAVMVWLVYVTVGLFFGIVRASHRARLLREQRIAEQQVDQLRSSLYNTVDARDTSYQPAHNTLSRSYTATEQETVVAGRL